MAKMASPHYCKHCRTTFRVRLDELESGDVIMVCPSCGWHHSRQFLSGIAVSCDPPRGAYIRVQGA